MTQPQADRQQAIGMLETYGMLAAVEGVDACLKAADVRLASFQYVSAGLVALMVRGDVGAVKASIDAGAAAIARVGRVVSQHVIARPHEETQALIQPPQRPGGRKGGTGIHKREFAAKPAAASAAAPPETAPKLQPQEQQAPTDEREPSLESAIEDVTEQIVDEVETVEHILDEERAHALEILSDRESLITCRTVDLRSMARRLPNIGLSREQIRFANKETLVEAILNALAQKE